MAPLEGAALATRHPWQMQVLRAVGMNRTAFGCICVAVFQRDILANGRTADIRAFKPPILGDECMVNEKGEVFVSFVPSSSPWPTANEADVLRDVWLGELDERFGTITQLRDQFRHVADTLKLSDQDRIAFVACLKRWVRVDQRVEKNRQYDL